MEFGFENCISSFARLLDKADAEQFAGLYPKKYFLELLKSRNYYLSIYADLLSKSFAAAKLDPGSAHLIDYGCGNGLLGLFAKYCGVKTVYMVDMDPEFISATQIISGQLSIEIDGFLTGNEDQLMNYSFPKQPNIVLGTDVIEHIYDLDHFLSILHQLNPNMVTGFTTASNPLNIFKVRQLKKLQLQDELTGSAGNHHVDPGLHLSYLKIRENIIRNEWPGEDDDLIKEFAKRTRGMNKKDILQAMLNYKLTGIFPAYPVHPTNTSNPLTGSWTERILSIREYQEIFERNKFSLNIFGGFYNDRDASSARQIKKLSNLLLGILGKNFSPFISLIGLGK